MKRLVWGAIALAVFPLAGLHAQGAAINELKGKIFDAHMLEKTFAGGLKFCPELNGKNFYLAPRNRVLNLEDYHRSLESLVHDRVYNPETKRPWSAEDAAARWERVQKEALMNKEYCDLVASLPQLEKELAALERKAEVSDKKE